ncbi:MAG TPA: quinone-dependent dihydroorotate dehydrogenase [Chloroflexaceae bacterium]|nr:quinone-dependent dihydroorotate dehydrogenase [Chloroflexaceae bacterium]
MYKALLRPILFRLRRGDAEAAHESTLALLGAVSRSRALTACLAALFAFSGAELRRTIFGLRFPNPVGLAAGMDKDGVALPAWAAIGFGFVEVGTVTWFPQPGNPRPRLFRLPADEALINRMGFNNRGATALAARLERGGVSPIPLGISIGKSKATPLESAVEDYSASFRTLFDHAGYFAVNVSSPNTPGLRQLQDREQLAALLAALQRENQLQSRGDPGLRKPILVKIAPDLGEPAIAELLEVCAEGGVSGLIATNTTTGRAGLRAAHPGLAVEAGGLSGRPLAARALEVVRFVAGETGGRLPIVGVGGIFDAAGACRMLDAGASLVQVYTGLVYEGPGLPRRINRGLARRRAAAPS